MMRGITSPTCPNASSGGVSFVALFADGRSYPATFKEKDRSKIALYFLLVCGIIVNGENLNFYVGLCFMSSRLTMVANPCANVSRASTWICEIASYSNVDEWGRLVTSASILSGDQSHPTETRHPTCTYCGNKFATECFLALHLGNTRPCNFPSMTPSGPVNYLSNLCRSSVNAVADLFFHQCCKTLSPFGVGCAAATNTLDLCFVIWLAPY